MIKFNQNKNLKKSSWLKILYRKYINPLKDVKHEKKPLNIILSLERLTLFAIKKPKNNDPIIETIKLLSIVILNRVAV